MNEKNLIGKKFKSIEDSEYGNIVITFEDGTKAYYDVSLFPDGTVSGVVFNEVLHG